MEIEESAELAHELATDAHEHGHADKPNWHRYLAATTLVFALLTAIGALLAGVTAHEALIESSEEAVNVTIIEGDRVSIEVLEAKHEILTSLGESPDPAELEQIARFEEEVAELDEEVASEREFIAEVNADHLILAVAVTILSISIALSGMAIVVDMKRIWHIGFAIGIAGTLGLLYGVTKLLGWT